MAKRSGKDVRKGAVGAVEQNGGAGEPGFEQTVGELERIVGELETGELSLEQSLAAFENGISLIRRAEAILNNAEKRVEVLLEGHSDGGQPEAETFPPGRDGSVG